MTKSEEALALFSQGYNCSQAVFSVFSDSLGLDKDLALKIAAGFGSGIRKAEVCGAVTGGVMAIGLKHGHSIKGDTDSKLRTYELTEMFMKTFEDQQGSVVCKKLLGYDLTQKEDFKVIQEKQLFQKICPVCIEEAVNLLEKMI